MKNSLTWLRRTRTLTAEQSRAEQSRAEQSRAEQSRAEQSRAIIFSGLPVFYAQFDIKRPISDTM